MIFKSRKFYVWLISLGAVLVVYLLYSLLSETPQIKIDTGAETTADSNLGDFGSEIGMVGDVGVGTVQVAKFITFNKNKGIDREFGFEKLLHEIGDEWEVEKPYMNIFRRDFKCYLTANRGRIQIEDAVGRPRPKDATLTGNVVIHILPETGSDIKESFTYLDDVVFISEKSQFSTDGPVKFVSENAQMLGKGIELVYNDELDLLEFLRIIHLETLRLKTSSETGLFSSEQTEQQAEPVATEGPKKAKQTKAPSEQVIEQKSGEYYRAVFCKNVVIDSPEQLIFADEISINDIFWSTSSSEKSTKADTGGTDNAETPTQTTEESVTSVQSKADTTSADSPKPSNVPVTSEPRELDEQFGDTVITCDNGILVAPMNSTRRPDAVEIDRKIPENFYDTGGRPTFVAQKINYSAPTDNAVASDSSELTFYVSDIMGSEPNETNVPVKITAQKKAEFLSASNQVIFEGNVVCTMLREDPNVQQKYTLSAPKLTVDLSGDKQSEADIEHLAATGGIVQLDTSKWASEEVLDFTKLKCRRFDYDASQQMFLATGPDGIMAVNNSKIAEPKACYVVVRDFETLKYFSEANRIITDAKRQQILIDYVPIVQGQYGQQITATAGHIDALLHETADGQNELSTLTATGGVTYEEEAKETKLGKGKAVEFVGSDFFYDVEKSTITAWGDELQPCLLNGTLAPSVEYNLKTGRIKTKITGPGILQMRR
jgi:hypothetical protein